MDPPGTERKGFLKFISYADRHSEDWATGPGLAEASIGKRGVAEKTIDPCTEGNEENEGIGLGPLPTS